MKNTVELETELIEMGFRIQSLLNNLNKQQNIILQILLRKDNSMAWYVQLFEPAVLLRTLEEAERNVAQNLEFPKKPNNGLVPEILRLADVSFVTENNQMLVMDLRLPLVTKRKFQALKGDFIPQINGTIVMSINLEKNIIIEEKTSSWGFVLSYAEFQECEKFLSYRICNKKAKEINLSSENECVLNLMYRNSTENCRIKLLK